MIEAIISKMECHLGFTELIELSKKCIQEPYALCEPYETDMEARKLILQLHDLGIFTYSSQLYRKDIKRTDEEYCEIWQKPYFSFIVAKEPSKLFRNLKEQREITVFGVLLRPYQILHDPGESVVTQSRTADSVQALSSAEWEIDTFLEAKDLSNEDLFSSTFFRQNRVWAIDVTATEWVDVDLFKIVERASTKGSQTLDELPPEVFENIAQHLEPCHILDIRLTSRRSREMAEYVFQQYFLTITVQATTEGSSKLQDFFQENVSQYTQIVVIQEDFSSSRSVLAAIRSTLEGVGRKITIVYVCYDLRSCDAPLHGYKWPIELEHVWTYSLQMIHCHRKFNPEILDLSSVQSIELLVDRYHSPTDYITYAKEALLSFISGSKENKRLSIVHYSDLSDEDENLLEMVKEAGIKVTKVHLNSDLVWKWNDERKKGRQGRKTGLTNFIQENNGVSATRIVNERRLGIVIGK